MISWSRTASKYSSTPGAAGSGYVFQRRFTTIGPTWIGSRTPFCVAREDFIEFLESVADLPCRTLPHTLRGVLLLAIAIAIVAACIAATVQSSFFEWAFHRFWLHRPWLPKDCFTTHTLIHHQLCKFDDTFHVTEEEQEEALHFQWWGGPFLVSLNIIPWVLAAWGLSTLGAHLPYLVFLIGFSVT